MKNYTNEQIYEALSMLKDICDNSSCDTCILRSNNDGCGIDRSPCNYVLNKPNEWLPFRQ